MHKSRWLYFLEERKRREREERRGNIFTLYLFPFCVNMCMRRTRHYGEEADDHPLFVWSLWWNDTRFLSTKLPLIQMIEVEASASFFNCCFCWMPLCICVASFIRQVNVIIEINVLKQWDINTFPTLKYVRCSPKETDTGKVLKYFLLALYGFLFVGSHWCFTEYYFGIWVTDAVNIIGRSYIPIHTKV